MAASDMHTNAGTDPTTTERWGTDGVFRTLVFRTSTRYKLGAKTEPCIQKGLVTRTTERCLNSAGEFKKDPWIE